MRLRTLCALLAITLAVSAQPKPNVTFDPVSTIKAAKGGAATTTITAHLPAGYHANTNKPTYAYLIPLKLTWTNGPLTTVSVDYPSGSLEKFVFADKPMSVVAGAFNITTTFKVPANVAKGAALEEGTLQYQACSYKACYPAKTVPVIVPVSVQ